MKAVKLLNLLCACTVLSIVSCEHKPLDLKETLPDELEVQFDWSALEAADEEPPYMDLYFYSNDLSTYQKFVFENDGTSKHIKLVKPSGWVSFVNSPLEDLSVENNGIPEKFTLVSLTPDANVDLAYGGLSEIAEGTGKLVLKPVCLIKHINVNLINSSELDASPKGCGIMLTGLSDKVTITGKVPSDAQDSRISTALTNVGDGNRHADIRCLHVKKTESGKHLLYVVVAKTYGNEYYVKNVEDIIMPQADKHIIDLTVDFSQMIKVRPGDPDYPEDVSQTGFQPGVDEFPNENINIEL